MASLSSSPTAWFPTTPAVEQENFHGLFPSYRDPMSVLRGPKLDFAYVNPSHTAFFGVDLLGAPLAAAPPTLADGPLADAIVAGYRSGESRSVEHVECRGADRIAYFDVTCTPWHVDGGSMDGVLTVAVDVTPSVRARGKARQVKGELENLFRQAPVGIAVFEDPDHVVLLANPTLQRIPWGGQRDDLVGTPFPRVMPEPPGRLRPEARDGVYRTGAAYVRNEAPWVLRNADGSPRTAYLNYVVDARRDGADNVVGTVVEVHDVTEQAQGWQRTEAALHARDSFLSIASHERRTPVTGMLLRNENVRRDFPRKKAGVLSEDNVLRWLEQTDHGLRRMDRLVADMLDASRWQLDETVLERTETDVVALLRGVAEAFAPELEAAKIAVSLLGPPSLRLSVDELRLEQVFSNLFTKAIRYAPGAPLAVSIVEDTRYVRFTFRDGGPGISRSDRERIFRRFERLVPADDISGLGLGLYIVRELVEAHGGTVRVESEPGDEAAFCVELPRVGPEGAAHGAAGRQRE